MTGGEAAVLDVAVIGGGQAALAAGYYLRRTGLSYALLDASPEAGGAWQHTWPSLRLFSPARWSSLPGWLMPATAEQYPTRDETIAYLREYERRYAIPVRRPVRIVATHDAGAALRLVHADGAETLARRVISATGSWSAPHIPRFPGDDQFAGRLLHSAQYRGPQGFAGQRVLVVGAGNSGAQIFADLVDHARVSWVTQAPPVFLPDHVDGQYLFDQATARYRAVQEGRQPDPPRSLGDIVMVDSVRAVRDRGLLQHRPMFSALTPEGVRWPDGADEPVDSIILATGFRPSLAHLAPLLTPDDRGRLPMDGPHVRGEPRVIPLGYGDWCGFASATLIGVGRAARAAVVEERRPKGKSED